MNHGSVEMEEARYVKLYYYKFIADDDFHI